MKKIIIAIIALGVISGGVYLLGGYSKDDNSNALTEKEIVSSYTITNVKEVFLMEDGGTIGVIAEKNSNEEFKFCLDGRMRMGFNTSEPYNFFVNATYPDREGAQELETYGEEERELLQALKDWLEDNFSVEKIDEFYKSDQPGDLTDEELIAYKLVNLLQRVEKR
ncbi:hypothetical protein HN670_03380 [bacterium]|jgi:hypothetical protein|nr:hypothetical protein [bacterium]